MNALHVRKGEFHFSATYFTNLQLNMIRNHSLRCGEHCMSHKQCWIVVRVTLEPMLDKLCEDNPLFC